MIQIKVIDAVFLAESVTTRSNVLVMINQAKNELERKKMSPYAKLGRVSGQSIRGWLRHALEKLLLQNGVSVCHPLLKVSVTADRNKEYYQRDLALGYHARGECKATGGCLVHQMFGDLDLPGNLVVPSILFFPTTTGDGSATKNVNKLFGTVGGGRLEVVHNSPRCRSQTHQVYMAIETLAGVMIEAPVKLVLRTPNKNHEIVLLKALEYLKTMVQGCDFDYLLGGMRTSGYGKAAILPLETKKPKRKNKSLIPEEEAEVEEESPESAKLAIQFELKDAEAAKLEAEFQDVIDKEKVKFPIVKEDSPKKED